MKFTLFFPPTNIVRSKPKCTHPLDPSSVSIFPEIVALGFNPIPHSAKIFLLFFPFLKS